MVNPSKRGSRSVVVLALSLTASESSFKEKLIPVLLIYNLSDLLMIVGAISRRVNLISSTICPNFGRTLITNLLPLLVV